MQLRAVHLTGSGYFDAGIVVRTSIIRHLNYPAQQINDIHYIFGVH